ncbi:hypothetical protein B5X24_HaOG202992, partial [Helicoverpa armigera]
LPESVHSCGDYTTGHQLCISWAESRQLSGPTQSVQRQAEVPLRLRLPEMGQGLLSQPVQHQVLCGPRALA